MEGMALKHRQISASPPTALGKRRGPEPSGDKAVAMDGQAEVYSAICGRVRANKRARVCGAGTGGSPEVKAVVDTAVVACQGPQVSVFAEEGIWEAVDGCLRLPARDCLARNNPSGFSKVAGADRSAEVELGGEENQASESEVATSGPVTGPEDPQTAGTTESGAGRHRRKSRPNNKSRQRQKALRTGASKSVAGQGAAVLACAREVGNVHSGVVAGTGQDGGFAATQLMTGPVLYDRASGIDQPVSQSILGAPRDRRNPDYDPRAEHEASHVVALTRPISVSGGRSGQRTGRGQHTILEWAGRQSGGSQGKP